MEILHLDPRNPEVLDQEREAVRRLIDALCRRLPGSVPGPGLDADQDRCGSPLRRLEAGGVLE